MKHIGIFLLILFPLSLLAQKISGKITNAFGEKILLANIIIKDSLESPTIKEFTVAKNGMYSITIVKQYKQLVLIVSASKYHRESFIIRTFDSTKDYTHDFILVRDTITKLQDITVTAKTRPYQIKGDTVSYTVSAYRDGTERKIQDVIKKLPGVEVNEKTGEIRYKGKSVETVKLDGEDLFASNYSIGTKNINVDMVEQVQAIENYSANPLLKGIEGGDKVALNLTSKKKKTDYSGSLDLGSGLLGEQMALDASTNILGISKKYKSFVTASYNNIGTNNTPFDYFSYNPNAEQLKEQDILAKKYIPDTYFDNDIEPERSNINNAFFGSYNAAFKIGKKLGLKTNLYYLSDNIHAEQLSVFSNNIVGQQFTTSDQYLIDKVPRQYRAEIEAKYNASSTSLIEYAFKYRIEDIKNNNRIVQNNSTHYDANLGIEDNHVKQSLTYTKKLSENKALQLIVLHSFNSIPQNYTFSPAVHNSIMFAENKQSSRFKKNNLNVSTILLGNTYRSKYSSTLIADVQNIHYKSSLVGINGSNEQFINGFDNDFRYSKRSFSSNSNIKLQFNRLRISPSLSLTFLEQSIFDYRKNKQEDTSCFLLEPSISFGYKLNSSSAILITSSIRQKSFSEEYFITNPVYISNRMKKGNELSLQIQQSTAISALYIVNDLYKQFQLNVGGIYSVNKGNFFTRLAIQQNSTEVFYFFLPENNSILSTNFMIEKYLSFLQGTVRLRNNYSLQRYKNIVNNSLLRNNKMQSIRSELFFKTAFDIKVNFENTLKHRFIKTKSEEGINFSNHAITNNFQVIVKASKQFLLVVSSDYYLPNTNKKNDSYFFLDFIANYQSKNKIYDFSFKAKNLTNNKNLIQFDTNDYSTTSFQTNLLQRMLLLSISRNF